MGTRKDNQLLINTAISNNDTKSLDLLLYRSTLKYDDSNYFNLDPDFIANTIIGLLDNYDHKRIIRVNHNEKLLKIFSKYYQPVFQTIYDVCNR